MAYEDSAPQSYKKAQGVAEWEKDMNEEMDALHQNNIWELMSRPKDVEMITCKWIFKLKKKVDGTIDRYKARVIFSTT